MFYDFDQPVDRRNTHSLKWDVKEHELPMVSLAILLCQKNGTWLI